jgi:TetR/AcrR family transcriptional regulator, cholesterol catabolism regulator
MAKRDGETWKRIVDQARELFAENGYNGTGVAAIARAAGVTNAGLYHYVDNKEELLFAVLDEAVGDHLIALEHIVECGLAPREALDKALDVHLDFVLGKPAAVRVFLSERRFLTGSLAAKYAASIKRYDTLFGRVIEQCLPAVSHRERKLLRFSILGMINWVPEWYDAGGPIGRTAVRRFMKQASIALVEHAATSAAEK